MIYQIVLDRSAGILVHGKYVVNGFNAVQKRHLATCLRMCSTPERYLATFLRMCSTPEVEKIDSKLMHVDSMTDKVKVSFDKHCKRLLDLCDEVGTKGNKKHVKREAKERFKHK